MDTIAWLFIVLALMLTTSVQTITCEVSGDGADNKSDLPLHPLKMTIEMFRYELYWEAPENASGLHYTVLYKMAPDEFMLGWDALPHCENMPETRCNIEEGVFTPGDSHYGLINYTFRIEGKKNGNNEIAYKTETIFFNSRRNVTLITPDFNLKLLPSTNGNEDMLLFVLPEEQLHWRDGNSIAEHIDDLQYQIEYWRDDEGDLEVKNRTAAYKELEVEMEVPSGEIYCVKLRLYAQYEDDNTVTTVSEWSNPPKCVEKDWNDATDDGLHRKQSEPSPQVIIGASAGILFLIVLILLICCGRKIRRTCKHMNEKGPLPDVLMMIFQDNSSQPNDRERRIYPYITEEKVDVLPSSPPTFCRTNYNDLIIPAERQHSGTSSSELDAECAAEEYLQLPVFDDEPLANVKFNMTYGIGYSYDSERDYFIDELQNPLLSRKSVNDRMGMSLHRPLLASSTVSDAESSVTPSQEFSSSSSRPVTISISSSGSEMGLIFDIQRSNDSFAKSNVYLHQSPVVSQQEFQTDIMNFAYSSNPMRAVPDALFSDYKNVLDITDLGAEAINSPTDLK